MWGSLPRFAKVASYIAAIAGAIVGVGTVWTMLELPVLATRGYVDKKEINSSNAQSEIVNVVIEITRDRREGLKRNRDALTARITASTDPQHRSDLQQLVEQANKDVAEVESRILVLERLRGK